MRPVILLFEMVREVNAVRPAIAAGIVPDRLPDNCRLDSASIKANDAGITPPLRLAVVVIVREVTRVAPLTELQVTPNQVLVPVAQGLNGAFPWHQFVSTACPVVGIVCQKSQSAAPSPSSPRGESGQDGRTFRTNRPGSRVMPQLPSVQATVPGVLELGVCTASAPEQSDACDSLLSWGTMIIPTPDGGQDHAALKFVG